MSEPLANLASGLTTAAKRALLTLRANKTRRTRGGWYSSTGSFITLRVANQLRAHGLVRSDRTTGRHQLVLTGAGRMLAEVIADRRREGKGE